MFYSKGSELEGRRSDGDGIIEKEAKTGRKRESILSRERRSDQISNDDKNYVLVGATDKLKVTLIGHNSNSRKKYASERSWDTIALEKSWNQSEMGCEDM